MRPGDLIGKYRLVRRLGHGAVGEVWAAVNVDADREVALKLITSPDPEVRRRLLGEARTIGRLDHPNIVQIFDRGETPQGEPFLVMQLLQGETLAERLLRERTLPQATAAAIALDVVRALRFAHEKEIVHRDLKPANIFLHREPGTGEDVVKVVDFGVSKPSIEDEGAATANGGLPGSPAYLSPEQVRGTAVDGRADIWALGVVLFEMLAGQRPFTGPTAVAVRSQITTQPIPRIETVAPHVSRAFGDLIAACLERDLTRRIASVELERRLPPLVFRGRHAMAGGRPDARLLAAAQEPADYTTELLKEPPAPPPPASGSWPFPGDSRSVPAPSAAVDPPASSGDPRHGLLKTQPLDPALAREENLRGGTVKLQVGAPAPSPTAPRQPSEVRGAPVTTTTAPLSGPPEMAGAPPAEPQHARSWPFVLLGVSILGLAIASALLVMTLREGHGGPAPAGGAAPSSAASSRLSR